jgi:sugar phosphate isomerase/epimerase
LTGSYDVPRLALVAECFSGWTLNQLLDWLIDAAPEITALEIGTGGYAPHPHCDRSLLLADDGACRRWHGLVEERGFSVAALNVWGNPVHPDRELANRHDRALRETIRLAAQLEVARVVALAGCPAALPGDRAPHFAAGGWLPYLEDVYEGQWERVIAPYWSAVSEFAASEDPDLLICIELHPGTAIYNVETFSRLAGLGDNLRATIDPSHFFWERMDPEAVIEALRPDIGHVHAKDLVFDDQQLATQGLLDHRWRGSSTEGPWRFATVGEGHSLAWWGQFIDCLRGAPFDVIAIEHEDPTVPAEIGVPRAAQVLAGALRELERAQRTPEPST